MMWLCIVLSMLTHLLQQRGSSVSAPWVDGCCESVVFVCCDQDQKIESAKIQEVVE